jgi:tetratricopeptide (TPR) repeat protein
MQVNAVTYVVQRTASLAATFYLLAILYFIKFRVQDKKRYFVFVMIFTVFAVFTKENTITIPFMLLFIEILFFLKDGKTSWKKRLLFIFILFLTVPIIPGTTTILHGYSQSDPNGAFKASTSMDRMQYFYTSLNVIILYIKLLFIPDYQNFDYSNDYPISHNLIQNGSYISLIIIILILVFALKNIKKNKLITLGIVWFFMGLVVESSFISIKDVYFEHRVYYPLAGFIITILGIAFAEYKFTDRRTLFKKPLLYFLVLSTIIIITNSALTLRRNYVYSDTVRLWSDVVKKAPRSDRGHSCLGSSYLDKYNEHDASTAIYLDDAERELKIAIEQYPNNDTAHCNLAKTYLLKGEYDKCISEAEETNRLNPSVYSYHNMGRAYEEKGDISNALWAYKQGYAKDSNCTFIVDDIGSLYYNQKDYKNAQKFYEEYQKISPYKSSIIEERLKEIKKIINNTSN